MQSTPPQDLDASDQEQMDRTAKRLRLGHFGFSLADGPLGAVCSRASGSSHEVAQPMAPLQAGTQDTIMQPIADIMSGAPVAPAVQPMIAPSGGASSPPVVNERTAACLAASLQ